MFTNFERTASAMEVECAKVLFGRSEANFKLRYSTLLQMEIASYLMLFVKKAFMELINML